jgi:hypothetical protein
MSNREQAVGATDSWGGLIGQDPLGIEQEPGY